MGCGDDGMQQDRNLYEEFFEGSKRCAAYQDEREYWKDLFACLDIVLLAGDKAKNGEKKEREEFQEKAVVSAVKNAKMHMKNRLLHTSKNQVFRYRYLMEQMGFTQWEQFLFLLSFAVSYDAKYETAFSHLQGGTKNKLPTLRLAVFLYRMTETLSDEEIAGALQKKGVLFQYFLVTSKPAEYNPMSFMMALGGRVCAFLYGKNELGEELEGLAEIYSYEDFLEPLLIRQDKKEQLSSYMAQILQNPESRGNVIQIYGMEGIGKRFLLQSMAKSQKTNLLFVDTAKLFMGTVAELRILFRRIVLESLLLGAVVCFSGYEQPGGTDETEIWKMAPQGLWFLLEEIRQEYMVAVWISEEKADFLLKHKLHVLYLELPMLTVVERECLWEGYAKRFPINREVDLGMCANQYILTPRSIQEVLWDAGVNAANHHREITKEDIRDAVGRQVKTQLGSLATLIRSVYTWEDLVIGSEQRGQLEMICNQVKYRSVVGEKWGFYQKTSYGRGISAMFYGAPGTGKTMAAQVMANELGLALYRIDISRIVSKYIGETEKNITDLFHRARHTNALLFFDEADSLFSKRAEVKDAHDRNANTETAHLLQKLEDYEGICILATNLIGNIDEAFKRRIKFMVNFVFPPPDVRLQLWETILPKALPLEEEIDFSFFAEQFELSGSSIKEILTNAAFLAAAGKRGLKNKDIVEATRLNFAKYGRVMTKEDFGYLNG